MNFHVGTFRVHTDHFECIQIISSAYRSIRVHIDFRPNLNSPLEHLTKVFQSFCCTLAANYSR